ncbi:nuclear condensin-like protein complex subunit Smc4 [Plenodomus tracheiphilus IPT5]|uniref:Structural maintenance of chromosomes protein n=1 Tax=Plenodomus tracheiphilus IPT5 TaxID=1408161 RepID=A0A6A7BAQ2_9PLEO|nr:nuclear condensin-like protein complex subunit Smc4 [Plenodomus tracheiphilus IPT5]
MASMSPRKSTRAAATRRKAPIVDDSDEEENRTPSPEVKEEQDEEEFTPAPAPLKTGRGRGRPRKAVATDEDATPKAATRRRTRVTESAEPTQLFTPAKESARASSPAKTAPKKRGRKPRVSVAESVAEETSHLLTPEQSASPEVSRIERASEATIVPGTPLADITSSSLNEQTPEQASTEESVDDITRSDDGERTPRAGGTPEPLAEVTQIDDRSQRPPPEPQREPELTAEPQLDMVYNVSSQQPLKETPMEIVAKRRAAAMPVLHDDNAPQQRTVITWLVLNNFKSYAGRQEVGPFHASFSAVVGPNGSGKSNVIDSLLFVFGFRASKMRQGKLSALIHNSFAFPDLDYCEVEVHFQEVKDLPAGGCEVIPDSQLVISRRAFKNNSSKYYINGKESTFTIVTTLLKDRGVDLDHKRFLILQGEVESIAQMKPKATGDHDDGLLEYLEDIVGTSKYKTPIEETAAELETLNEICREKNARVQHVEKEKSGLEEKKNKALAYIRNENELATKQCTLYQIYISEFDDHIQVTQESVDELQAQLHEELAKHQGNEEGIKELERQYRKGTKGCEQLEKKNQEYQKEVARIDKETVKFEEKKKFLAGKQKKLEKIKDTSSYGRSEAETLAKQYAADLVRYNEEIADLEDSMKVEEKELEAVRRSLAGKTQGLSDEIAAKQKSLEPWSAKINEKQSAIAVAESELDILRERENAGAMGIASIEEKIASLEASKEAKAEELAGCKAEKKHIAKELQKVQAQLEDLAQKEPAIRSKLSGARAKADEAHASLSSAQTQGNVLSALMRLKESGRVDGFHGRLGNLGTIDQKYDVAVSTACPRLDCMVTDTVESAQQCIAYLKKNNLGRGNFIILDKLNKKDMSPVQTPENVERLFDLVKAKHEKFNPAFFSAMANTLVTDDLDQATRVSYHGKRWKVVTLDGKLVDISGTMTGGGTRVIKGKMSSRLASDVSKDQVTKLQQDRDTLEKTFTEFQQEQRNLETTLRDLNQQLPLLDTKAQKLALELESYDRNLVDCQRRIKEIGAEQSSTKSDKGRVTSLEKSMASLEKEVAKLHAETAGVEAEIKELQDKIMEIGGVKLRSQKAKVDGLKQQIDTLTEQASSAEVSRSKEDKQRAKHEKAQADAIKELEKLTIEAEKIEEDMESQRRDASGIRQQAEEAQEALETQKEELEVLKKELDEKTAELNETRAAEIEMRNKLEEGKKSLGEFQKKQAYFQDKMSKLVYQNITDLGEAQESEEGLPSFSKDELQDMDKAELKAAIASLERTNESTQVDLAVLEEYRKRVEEHASRSSDLATATQTRDVVKARGIDLSNRRRDEFQTGFDLINARLKEMYQMITMGGLADLVYADSTDAFLEGIQFSVKPPKKSYKIISNLSGGEKTLASLALVFALHHYKPTPLYVMDEIDAALDFRNVSIIAGYIKERTRNAQFIVISLRNNMFELSSRLVGVYKVNHMTKSVTIENRDYITGRA